MRVGFTGTQGGMSWEQRGTLKRILTDLVPAGFHHGDCIGADAEAHLIATDLGIEVVIHPPDNDSKRAFCEGAVHVEPVAPYLTRNRAIVDACDVLVAAPRSSKEVLRSGTWSTIRYARSLGMPVLIMARDA